MARLRYSSYIPSKALWQKEIPSHWKETELRMLFADNKDKNIGLIERNLLSLSYGKLKRKDIDNATGLVPASFEGYQIIDEGYIVLRFTDLQNDKKSLRVGYVEEKGIITSAYIGLAPKADIHSKYFYYQLHFLDKIKYFYNLGGGVRQSLAFKEFGRETVLIPPKEEQTAIARFLDYKLAKINRFIKKKKQLIKLLNEQKAAIINQAATKGLDLNAKMKDSGIEWLGDIPEHWEVWKLGRAYKHFGSGTTPSSGYSQYYENGTIPWVNTGDLNDGILEDCEKKITQKAFDDYSVLKIFPKGTLSVAMYGASIGKVSIIDFEATTNQACCNFYSSDVLLDKFTFLWFIANKTRIVSLGYGGTQPNISQGLIKALRIPVPPKNEQMGIIEFLEKETATINTTISKIEKELALTEEYKTALIAEAVTGKIDVRGYVVPEKMEEDPDSYRDEEIEEEMGMVAEDEETYQNIIE
jgi:type I restriction enzyme S subunit